MIAVWAVLLPFQALATALFYAVDKLLMGGAQDGLPEFDLAVFLGLEGVKKCLVLAGGIHTAFHADLVQGVNKTEAGSGYPNGADEAGLVGIDFVGRTGNVIGTGSSQIGNDRIHRNGRMQLA